MLKHNGESANENFPEHKKLIGLCKEKFNSDVCVVCELPPWKNVQQYQEKNEIFGEINNLISSYYSDKPSFKLCFLNAIIKNVNNAVYRDNGSDSIGYNFLYFDNVHLNYQHGMPLLKNWLLSHLLWTSNRSISPKGLYQNKSLINKVPPYTYSSNNRNKPYKYPQTDRKNFLISNNNYQPVNQRYSALNYKGSSNYYAQSYQRPPFQKTINCISDDLENCCCNCFKYRTLNIFFSSTQQYKYFYLVLILSTSRQ